VEAALGEAADLAALCGNLPLALRIAGQRLATRPTWSLGYLTAQLRDHRTRLTSLSAGDLQVRSAFEVSYRRLSPGGRMVFRRLAAVPGEDFGIELVRVAAETSERDAFARLDELVDASMVLVSPVQGRFRFHDLIRIFARELWETEHAEVERDRITEAVLGHLLSTACAAGMMCFPNSGHSDVFGSMEEAFTWLDHEVSNWLAAVREAARRGWHREVLALAMSMHWYSDDHWFAVPWEEVFLIGVEAARALGDKLAEAKQLNFVGWALRWETSALEFHEQALQVAVEAGDALEQVWSLSYIGAAHALRDNADQARRTLRQSVRLSTRFDFWDVQLAVRQRYGKLLLQLGEPAEAHAVLRALLADVEVHSTAEMPQPRKRMVAIVMETVGLCLHRMHDCRAAAVMFARARNAYAEIGSRLLEARGALWEGRCRIDAGDMEEAAVVLEHALAACEELSMPEQYAEVKAELARLPAR
jgi:tetratricopeptide (TPR) repeat protein